MCFCAISRQFEEETITMAFKTYRYTMTVKSGKNCNFYLVVFWIDKSPNALICTNTNTKIHFTFFSIFYPLCSKSVVVRILRGPKHQSYTHLCRVLQFIFLFFPILFSYHTPKIRGLSFNILGFCSTNFENNPRWLISLPPWIQIPMPRIMHFDAYFEGIKNVLIY